MKSIVKKYGTAIAFTGLAVVAMTALMTALDRPLWFDEAVSLMNFATLPYHEIYTTYTIPNNHILFNVLLKTWLETVAPMMSVSDVQFRVPALLISLVTISAMFAFWRRRLGGATAFIVCLSFAVSTPFIIYGTALRGYMLSIFFIILGMEFSLRWRESSAKKYLVLYFLSTLAAVAVIPTNLLAFAAITFMPPHDVKYDGLESLPSALYEILRKRLILGVLPVAAFLMFYAPLWRSLFSALKHNNGWLSSMGACEHLYAGFALSCLPLILLALAGLAQRKRDNIFPGAPNILTTIFVVALPALVIISRSPSPFPRVFFCFWPIWLYMAGSAARWGGGKCLMFNVQFSIFNGGEKKTEENKKNKPRPSIAKTVTHFAIIATAVILWGVFTALYAPQLSTVFTKKHSQDDFFKPYFAKGSFDPLTTVNTTIGLTGGEDGRVFLSQNCDFPSIIFYGKLKELSDSFWLFDSPNKAANPFPKTPKKLYIVARDETDLLLITKRFGIIETIALSGNANNFQKIYEVKFEKQSRTPPNTLDKLQIEEATQGAGNKTHEVGLNHE